VINCSCIGSFLTVVRKAIKQLVCVHTAVPWHVGLVGDFVTTNDTPKVDFLCLLYFRATSDLCSYISSPDILLTCCLWSCKGAGQGYFKGEAHSLAWIEW